MNSSSLISFELHRKVVTRVSELFDAADKSFGKKFIRPFVVYKNRGKVAGTARYRKNELSLNPKLLIENVEAFINDTIPHEVGHFIAAQEFGEAGHGVLWEIACKSIGMDEPNQYHNYNIDSVRIKQHRWQYACSCRVREYSTTKHNKIQRGMVSYKCKLCGQQTYPVMENGTFKKV